MYLLFIFHSSVSGRCANYREWVECERLHFSKHGSNDRLCKHLCNNTIYTVYSAFEHLSNFWVSKCVQITTCKIPLLKMCKNVTIWYNVLYFSKAITYQTGCFMGKKHTRYIWLPIVLGIACQFALRRNDEIQIRRPDNCYWFSKCLVFIHISWPNTIFETK